MLRTLYSQKQVLNCARTATKQNRTEPCGKCWSLSTTRRHSIPFIICSVWISGIYLIYMIHSKENSIRHSFVYFRFYSGAVGVGVPTAAAAVLSPSVYKWVCECDFHFRLLLDFHCAIAAHRIVCIRFDGSWQLLYGDTIVFIVSLSFLCVPLFFCFSSLWLGWIFLFGFSLFHCMELTSKNFVICLLQATKTIPPN